MQIGVMDITNLNRVQKAVQEATTSRRGLTWVNSMTTTLRLITRYMKGRVPIVGVRLSGKHILDAHLFSVIGQQNNGSL